MAAVARGAASGVRRSKDRLDRFQQRGRVLAVPFAVIRKFGDDQAGNLAVLLTLTTAPPRTIVRIAYNSAQQTCPPVG